MDTEDREQPELRPERGALRNLYERGMFCHLCGRNLKSEIERVTILHVVDSNPGRAFTFCGKKHAFSFLMAYSGKASSNEG